MERIKNFHGEHHHNNKGVAMIIVLCVMAVFMALSLALLLGASTVAGTAKKAAVSERCKAAAVTFSKMIGAELTDESNSNSSFRDYLKHEITGDDWQCYDETNPNSSISAVTRDFRISVEDDASAVSVAGKINGYDLKVQMYWEAEKELLETRISANPDTAYHGISLVIVAVGSKGKESYTISTRYNLICEADGKWKWKTGAVE